MSNHNTLYMFSWKNEKKKRKKKKKKKKYEYPFYVELSGQMCILILDWRMFHHENMPIQF